MLISIIVPFYKGNEYINDLLYCIKKNAILFKNLGDIEMVLVNDSPNYLLEYDKTIIGNAFELQIYNNKKNSGIHQTRINGLKYAKGEYVLMLDQDDLISDNAILSQFMKINSADMVICNGHVECKNSDKLLYTHRYAYILATSLLSYLYYGCQICSPGQCLIKKNSIPSEWYEHILKINCADDFFLWILFIHSKNKIVFNQENIYLHRKTGVNVSDDIENMRASERAVYNILKNNKLIPNKYLKKLNRRLNCQQVFHDKVSLFKKLVSLFNYIDVIFFYSIFRLFRWRR